MRFRETQLLQSYYLQIGDRNTKKILPRWVRISKDCRNRHIRHIRPNMIRDKIAYAQLISVTKKDNFSYEKKRGKNFNFEKEKKQQDEHDERKKLIKMDLRYLKRGELKKNKKR